VQHFGAIVVLETMWDWCGLEQSRYGNQGPPYFEINPDNHSGRRLYYLLDGVDFRVTNACPQVVSHSSQHGTPDVAWLTKNLQSVTYDLLLVCGRVAQQTFRASTFRPTCPILNMKHPAARNWTNEEMDRWRGLIRRLINANQRRS
jgi:hypothetical protein